MTWMTVPPPDPGRWDIGDISRFGLRPSWVMIGYNWMRSFDGHGHSFPFPFGNKTEKNYLTSQDYRLFLEGQLLYIEEQRKLM